MKLNSFSPSVLLALGIAIGSHAAAIPDTADVAASCPSVIARIPPSLSSTTNPCFTATPSGYFQGIFYETYSSATSLQALKNVWLDTTHDSTTNGNDDLTSYQVISCNDNHVYTSYSNNSFEAGMVDVFPFHLGGTSSSTTYLQELVSYGTDTGGNGYFVMYGNDPNKDLVIASKVTTGPTSATVSGIKSAISALGNSALNKLVSALEPITHDNARNGLPTPTCTTSNCLNNVDSYSGTCQ